MSRVEPYLACSMPFSEISMTLSGVWLTIKTAAWPRTNSLNVITWLASVIWMSECTPPYCKQCESKINFNISNLNLGQPELLTLFGIWRSVWSALSYRKAFVTSFVPSIRAINCGVLLFGQNGTHFLDSIMTFDSCCSFSRTSMLKEHWLMR